MNSKKTKRKRKKGGFKKPKNQQTNPQTNKQKIHQTKTHNLNHYFSPVI